MFIRRNFKNIRKKFINYITNFICLLSQWTYFIYHSLYFFAHWPITVCIITQPMLSHLLLQPYRKCIFFLPQEVFFTSLCLCRVTKLQHWTYWYRGGECRRPILYVSDPNKDIQYWISYDVSFHQDIVSDVNTQVSACTNAHRTKDGLRSPSAIKILD